MGMHVGILACPCAFVTVLRRGPFTAGREPAHSSDKKRKTRMKNERYGPEIKAVVSPEDARARYDRAAKEILALPYLCALILKKTFPETFTAPLDETASRLTHSLTSDDHGLKDQLTELEKPSVKFDSLCLYICETEEEEVLVIDIEVQNSDPGARNLAGRLFYYVGNMLVAQKNDASGFAGDSYGDVKKVQALWILPHMDNSYLIDCRTKADVAYTDSKRAAGSALAKALDGFIRVKVASIGVKWADCENEAIQCLGHIFRDSLHPERQIRYLEKEGIPVTVQTRKELDEYNDSQVVWLDPKMKDEYDLMKDERDVMKKSLEWFKKNCPAEYERYLEENK